MESAAANAIKMIGYKKNDPNLLVITNAGYGQLDGNRTTVMLDILSEISGCTAGKNSLLGALTAHNTPVWFSMRSETGKTVFFKWDKGSFVSQVFNTSPDALLKYKSWQDITRGTIGTDFFYTIASITALWLENAPWYVLKGAEMHGAACPGNYGGFLVHHYLQEQLPLDEGDRYHFIFAPPTCAMDILRVIYASSAGQKQMFAIQCSGEKLSTYFSSNIVTFATVMRVNQKKDICDGVVLGFDLQSACRDADVDITTFFPKGLRTNPLFGFSRTKVCHALAVRNIQEQMVYISERKVFSGDATMARQITECGYNPYSVIFTEHPSNTEKTVLPHVVPGTGKR